MCRNGKQTNKQNAYLAGIVNDAEVVCGLEARLAELGMQRVRGEQLVAVGAVGGFGEQALFV